ncbi:MAG TPA: DNA internalization-related competence protein ComEC/Rec2 [Gallionellaceae bacterium]|nr:DNA internalization-related competence protein ComEC/Rec2 [Gallionellaceae bacterium]
MVGFSIFFALGVWLLQQQAALPDLRWAVLLIILLVPLRLPRQIIWQRIFHIFILFTLAACSGFFYAAWVAQYRLADELPAAWQGRDITLIGIVAEMPRQHERGLGFKFDVERNLTDSAYVPQHILLSTYNSAAEPILPVHAGERWQLTVRLKQPHGTSNPYNFDFEAWVLEQNLRATGYVYGKGDNRRIDDQVAAGYFVEVIREAVRTHFQQVLGQLPYAGVLSALAIGDQGSIPAEQWQVFTRTGVNHLMSISGLHITMLSGMAFSLVYWLWRRSVYLTLWLPARKAAALAGLLAALVYALISGYGIPAQRTVYMLGTVAAALWLSRNIAPSQLLAVALMVVLLFDPWAVISPGFWLSFGAVGLIFFITANRLGQRHWLIEYCRIQWAMSIGLIPPLLAMFQQISLVAPIANAFAIPLVSFVVVPLSLLGAILPFDWLLHLAHQAMSMCMVALVWLNSMPDAVWTQHAPPVWSIAVGMTGVLWLLLPRGFPSRWVGGILLLPMFLIQPAAPAPGSLRLTVFDVGQGLAVAAQTHKHALLYDTGPAFNSEANSGNRILVPALKGMGIAQLDSLMLTHNDSDHTGGALSVMQAIPVLLLSTSLPDDSPILRQAVKTRRCSDGQSWDWDGVHFELLHPALASYAEEKIINNDLGCVLRISNGKNSVLLTADIEKNAERRLLELHPDKLDSTMLVVPHHGSKTSSTTAFVAAVHPRYAVFTSGYRNRFGHPKEEVVERYHAAGSELLRSDEDGAILVEMEGEHLHVERYRKTHTRYWQAAFSTKPQ